MNIKYRYDLAATQGTTGYAECRPEPEPPLEDALALLAERPLDTFLHRYALSLLLRLDAAAVRNLGRQCAAQRHPALASLLLEAHALAPHLTAGLDVKELEAIADPFFASSPLTILSRQPNPPLRDVFHANIHRHIPIDASCADMAAMARGGRQSALAGSMLAAKGALSELYASMLETAAGDNLPDAAAVYEHADGLLAAAGITKGPEMRHEASLCPIALLRQWNLRACVEHGRNKHELTGVATAYGRGLKLMLARTACAMEALERACAHACIDSDGYIGGKPMVHASYAMLTSSGRPAVRPSALGAIAEADMLPLHWLPGMSSDGEETLVPAQAVYLFCNLDEVSVFEHIGSTGLASGATAAQAKLAALTEALERDAHATAPFSVESCFELDSRDETIAALLADYRWRGIRVQFQDIANEFGLPAWRCFVRGHDGSIAQATGAGLSGPRAALAALTETPWPYIWARPAPAPSGPGLPSLPRRFLEDLPDYSLPSAEQSLALLEAALARCGLAPVYADISRADLHFPVFRAFVPGLENDPELEMGPSQRLLARYGASIC